MLIGERLRAIREAKNLSQGDIHKRSGLLRPYLSRVECGHTVPTVETLEKLAHALEVPLYELFYEGAEPPKPPHAPKRTTAAWGSTGKDSLILAKFRESLSRMKKSDQQLLLQMAQRMAKR